MLELLSLEFGGIRSFVEDQSIDFEHREKLIQIDGKNENTGGSSGAGKSSVVMALLYLLDLSDVATTVLQSRVTKKTIWASGKFKVDGVPVTISRSKKDGLTIELPDETVSGNSDLAEEKLEQLMGIPKKIFKKMVHKKQKETGFFLKMTAQEMYKFLIGVLGLEKHVTEIDMIVADIDVKTKAITDKMQQIDLTKSSLADMQRILSEKKTPVPTVHPDEISQLNSTILSTKEKITALKAEMKTATDSIAKEDELVANTADINEKIAALVPARVELNAKLTATDGPKKKLEADLNAIPFAIKDATKVGEEISKIRAEKEHIEKSQCPTCMQTWVGENATAKIATMDQSIQTLISNALGYKKIIDSKPEIQANLDRLIGIRSDIEAQLLTLQEQRTVLDAQKYALMEDVSKQNEQKRTAYKNSVIVTEAQYKADIEKLNEAQKAAEIDLSAKESQHNSYITTAAQYVKETSSLQSIITQKTEEIAAAEAALIDLRKKIVIAEESKRMIKAYVLNTFQETLDAIGAAATDILAGVPNMATSTIYFEGCKETKSGNIKDEIVAIINMDGVNDIPIKSLSGGEETTTHLAVDLAVIDVIETKVNKGANFLFMDEPFDGLDSVCKENCLELLKQLDTNKKIIMVDHSSELKEMVSDIILVVKKGDTSTIQA